MRPVRSPAQQTGEYGGGEDEARQRNQNQKSAKHENEHGGANNAPQQEERQQPKRSDPGYIDAMKAVGIGGNPAPQSAFHLADVGMARWDNLRLGAMLVIFREALVHDHKTAS